MRRISACLLAVVLMLLSSCGSVGSKTESSEIPSQTLSKTKAELILSELSLEQKIGQLFIVEIGSQSEPSDELLQDLSDKYVGGVILFKSNVKNPESLKKLTKALGQCSHTEMFIAVDEEGGRVARLANNSSFNLKKYSSMLSVGATGDISKATEVGVTIGTYLKEFGINLNFGPVADVFTNPNNTVIGDRAFSTDPQIAANMVVAAVAGFKSSETVSCIKHFPGHGDTNDDTHSGRTVLSKDYEQLSQCELIPFISAINSGVPMIMSSHICLPEITGNTPSSLSREMITDILRNKLNYNGVVVTDSLSMGAITKYYTPSQAAILALQAGNDILLMPSDFSSAYEAIYSAVVQERISLERIDESVLRILELKIEYGIIK